MHGPARRGTCPSRSASSRPGDGHGGACARSLASSGGDVSTVSRELARNRTGGASTGRSRRRWLRPGWLGRGCPRWPSTPSSWPPSGRAPREVEHRADQPRPSPGVPGRPVATAGNRDLLPGAVRELFSPATRPVTCLPARQPAPTRSHRLADQRRPNPASGPCTRRPIGERPAEAESRGPGRGRVLRAI